jgi:DNA-binding Xre family transcriptional regulator
MGFSYNKLFKLLKERDLTMYSLRRDKVVGTETLEKMRKGTKNIDTRSLDNLCNYLNCRIEDIMEHVPEPVKAGE